MNSSAGFACGLDSDHPLAEKGKHIQPHANGIICLSNDAYKNWWLKVLWAFPRFRGSLIGPINLMKAYFWSWCKSRANRDRLVSWRFANPRKRPRTLEGIPFSNMAEQLSLQRSLVYDKYCICLSNDVFCAETWASLVRLYGGVSNL